mgnify:FL=1|jgi:hypothetical protein
MAEWKKEIRKLCRDFCLSKEIYNKIIKETENNKRKMPGFYTNANDYKYDTAYAQLKSYILA